MQNEEEATISPNIAPEEEKLILILMQERSLI